MRAIAKSLLTLSFLAIAVAASHRSPSRGYAALDGHPHHRRQITPAPAGQSAYTYLTPSPGALPVPITQQHQAVTSFAPVITVCPQINRRHAESGQAPVAVSSAGAAFSGASNDSCSTGYSPVVTTVCHTILQALMSAVTVTACDQQVTFSERLGYKSAVPSGVADARTLVPPASPAVETASTFYIAPWSELTSGAGAPSSITEKVCVATGNGTSQTVCVDNLVAPRTLVVTFTRTSTTELQFTTNIQGPAKVTVRNVTFDVTNTDSVIALSTKFPTEYSTETTSTSLNTLKTGTPDISAQATPTHATPLVNDDTAVLPTMPDSNDVEAMTSSAQSPESSFSSELPTSTRTTTVNVTVEGESASSTTTQTNMHTAVQSLTMTRPLSLATPQMKLANNATS